MSDALGHKAAKGAVWATVERFSIIALQFLVNIVLAHLLLPSDYGAIAVLSIFIIVSQALIDAGFGSALIQKKHPTQTDYSTIFYWNVTFSTLLYMLLFVAAPWVASFYRSPELCGVLRAIGLSLIVNAVLSIQQVRLRKALAFRALAFINVGAYVLSAAAAIVMACEGMGVWTLVAMQLLYGVISIVLLMLITRWRPSPTFSRQTMRELFNFGGFMMAANLLQTVCQNLQGVIIGRKFNQTQMGFYNQAYRLDQVTSYSIPQVIVQVMYPVYSSIQDDRRRLCEMVLMNIRVICLIVFPILTCLIVVAEPLICRLYGEIWLPAAPYFQVMCVGGLFAALQNVNFYAVAAVGRSRSLFNWSIYKWGFLLAALLIGMNFGMFGLLWGMVLSSANIFFVNAFLARRHVGIPLLREFRIIGAILFIAMVAMAVSLAANLCLGWNPWLCVVIQLAMYLILIKLFQPLAIEQLLNIINRLLKRK